MSTRAQPQPMALPHAVFLQRVADEPATAPEVRLGQGAFLALRFVDLLSPDREAPSAELFRYQWAATERYCAELSGEGTEAAHLSGIVRATGEAQRTGDVRVLAPALLAYALYLEEEEAHFDEAEDVLLTLPRVAGERLSATDRTATALRLGRVLRKLARWDEAEAAYAEAGRIAAAAGDQESVLRSRIGQCNVLVYQGNLPEAERGWRAVLEDATTAGLTGLAAHAEHGLGTVLYRRGQPHEGAPHVWRAYARHEDPTSKLRALGDLGTLLLSLGDVTGAERALAEVMARGRLPDMLTNAAIELMHCASFRRDRVGFERWRERSVDHLEDALPNVRADYYLKVGIGLARFGNYRRAESEMGRALDIAVAHDLHEMVFRAERIKSGLQDCEALAQGESHAAEPAVWTEAIREVSASLAALSA
jgi:tetratricopeptide (TPR) repeat protein